MGKIKKLVLSGLIAGTLMASAEPVLADSPWWGRANLWRSNRAELRSNYARLEAARARLEYDRRHNASRYRLAQDRAAIQAILDEIERDRRRAWNGPRGWDRYGRDYR
jgi:hypothetical protein